MARKMKDALRLPVVNLGAEHLAIGYLMRRNILAYKAPPGNEGYDVICIHPNPRESAGRQVKVQVKSRYATDCDRGVVVHEKSFGAFNYLMLVFMNIGWYYSSEPTREGQQPIEIFTLPAKFVKRHHHISKSGWERLLTKGADMMYYLNERGIEQIANDLGVPYPAKMRK